MNKENCALKLVDEIILERNVSHCDFVHHKFHTNWPGIETGPPRWKAGDLPSEIILYYDARPKKHQIINYPFANEFYSRHGMPLVHYDKCLQIYVRTVNVGYINRVELVP